MTLNIQVNVPEDVVKADQAATYIGRALAAIGFARSSSAGLTSAPLPAAPETTANKKEGARRSASRKSSAAAAAAEETATDDNATEDQDKADETAEVEEDRSEESPLTVEDVKAVVNGYVKKFGMPATQEDGPKIFVEALGAPPAGEQYWRMSILPEDQDALKKVIETWKKATELNPLKRKAV